MKLKAITFEGGQHGCFRVHIGGISVGSYTYDGSDKEKPWTLKLELPGVKSVGFRMANEDAARELVHRAALLSFSKLFEQ